ncbi:MAG: hypothetical protein KDA63_19160, partial [Planctomycetales bacterium]|nr:hypothetical protein [Planctomycetales bacterium]
ARKLQYSPTTHRYEIMDFGSLELNQIRQPGRSQTSLPPTQLPQSMAPAANPPQYAPQAPYPGAGYSQRGYPPAGYAAPLR